jgi:polyhydroxyalkanoate synthesis regulator phasin
MQMSSKKNVIAIAITTVVLTVASVGISNASTKTKVVQTKSTRTSVNSISNPLARGVDSDVKLAAVLSALVAKGSITQAQADAVIAAATVARTNGRTTKDAARAAMEADRIAAEALIAKTIGLDTATVRTRLAAGESLGAIAGAKKAELIVVLVSEATKRIDTAVAAGKMTAAQAVTLKAGLTAHVTAEVDRVGGKRGPGMEGHKKGDSKMGHDGKNDRGHGGFMGRGMGSAPLAPAATVAPTST